MPVYQGSEMTSDEYVSARLGIAFPPSWKSKMVVMAGLVGHWEWSLKNAIMGVYDDEYDTHVSELFDAWARGEMDIIECAQRQKAYELSRGLLDEREQGDQSPLSRRSAASLRLPTHRTPSARRLWRPASDSRWGYTPRGRGRR